VKLDWPPAEKHFEQMTDFQYRVLSRVADREDKSFICLSGEPGTKDEADRTLLFNEFLRLIELGFFLELNRNDERYARMIQQFEQKSVCLVMAEMTNRGQWMWEQTPWENWVN
jgi:hypothetical protein